MSKDKENNTVFIAQIAIVVTLLGVLLFGVGGSGGSSGMGIALVSASEIIPTGVPAIYGEELGISYDHISAVDSATTNKVIRAMGNIDRSIELEGEDLVRYIDIVSKISCEYCCGAKSIIFEDGRAACGCAHSFAMRGIAKYLITEHPTEFTDDEILAELGKWKILFFPGIHENKAAVMEGQGISTDVISLTSNMYRGIEKGVKPSSGDMVGGC